MSSGASGDRLLSGRRSGHTSLDADVLEDSDSEIRGNVQARLDDLFNGIACDLTCPWQIHVAIRSCGPWPPDIKWQGHRPLLARQRMDRAKQQKRENFAGRSGGPGTVRKCSNDREYVNVIIRIPSLQAAMCSQEGRRRGVKKLEPAVFDQGETHQRDYFIWRI
jgi:hypothetical protein